jgi:hypothetical protein
MLAQPQIKWWKASALLGPIERPNLDFWKTSISASAPLYVPDIKCIYAWTVKNSVILSVIYHCQNHLGMKWNICFHVL